MGKKNGNGKTNGEATATVTEETKKKKAPKPFDPAKYPKIQGAVLSVVLEMETVPPGEVMGVSAWARKRIVEAAKKRQEEKAAFSRQEKKDKLSERKKELAAKMAAMDEEIKKLNEESGKAIDAKAKKKKAEKSAEVATA